MSPSPRGGGLSWGHLIVACAVLVAVGVRVYNVFVYPIGWGFDSEANWRYIERLLRSWALPAPDADWSTAHPPLFYYLSAAIARGFGLREMNDAYFVLRLFGAAAGLASVAIIVALIRRVDPDNPRRACIAGALILFLPVHLYMSAMLSEELWVSFFTTLALAGIVWDYAHPQEAPRRLARMAGIGIVAGLAWLTKLSGVLVIAAIALSESIVALRRGEVSRRIKHLAVLVVLASVIGGWFYLRNLIRYGYLYPHGLTPHQVMYDMPPGERHFSDYWRIPLATFFEPQLLNEDLLHSVWGGTYVTIFFDGQRHFLPRKNWRVRRVGTVLLFLGLLPTAAFFIGMGRGARRALREPRSPDTPLLLLVGLTFAGYLLFTLRNPWFPVIKGSFLLGLVLPFAYQASEVLSDWTRARGLRSTLVWTGLAVLWIFSAVAFTYENHLWASTPNDSLPDVPGLGWGPPLKPEAP